MYHVYPQKDGGQLESLEAEEGHCFLEELPSLMILQEAREMQDSGNTCGKWGWDPQAWQPDLTRNVGDVHDRDTCIIRISVWNSNDLTQVVS